jgi:hypothetical protein
MIHMTADTFVNLDVSTAIVVEIDLSVSDGCRALSEHRLASAALNYSPNHHLHLANLALRVVYMGPWRFYCAQLHFGAIAYLHKS